MKNADELDKKLYGSDTIKIYGPYGRLDGRQHVIIRKSDLNRWTVSYPKYLMERKLERRLEPNETVDHINEVFQEKEENFQLLSRGDNIRKSNVVTSEIECKCGKLFQQRRKEQIFCSMDCKNKFGRHNNQYQKQ